MSEKAKRACTEGAREGGGAGESNKLVRRRAKTATAELTGDVGVNAVLLQPCVCMYVRVRIFGFCGFWERPYRVRLASFLMLDKRPGSFGNVDVWY